MNRSQLLKEYWIVILILIGLAALWYFKGGSLGISGLGGRINIAGINLALLPTAVAGVAVFLGWTQLKQRGIISLLLIAYVGYSLTAILLDVGISSRGIRAAFRYGSYRAQIILLSGIVGHWFANYVIPKAYRNTAWEAVLIIVFVSAAISYGVGAVSPGEIFEAIGDLGPAWQSLWYTMAAVVRLLESVIRSVL